MVEPEFLRPCLNPACERIVPANFLGARQTNYCCGACADAHERGYEIHEGDSILSHSPGCNHRWHERQGREVKFAR